MNMRTTAAIELKSAAMFTVLAKATKKTVRYSTQVGMRRLMTRAKPSPVTNAIRAQVSCMANAKGKRKGAAQSVE